MQHWKRILISNGFEWINRKTQTSVLLQVRDNRWTATLSLLLASGERENSNFFVEDSYNASLEKCLLYVWRALSVTDKATFDLDEAQADLRRFVSS
jgi:hypothetical protein